MGNQTVDGPHWLMGGKKYYGCLRAHHLTFFKISSFVLSRTKIFIKVWNNLRVS